MTNDFNSNANIQKQDSANAGLGKVLASDSGISPNSILLNAVLTLIIGGLMAWFCCVFLPANIRENGTTTVQMPFGGLSFTQSDPKAEQAATFVFWVGVVFVAGGILITVLNLVVAGSTKITVYENGIAGVGTKPAYTLRNFRLTYDQISSIEVNRGMTGGSITIYTPGTKYLCYGMKSAEIQRIILEQQQKKT